MDLRKHFIPIQPSVKALQADVDYQEFTVAQGLQDLIHCYWQLKTNHNLAEPYNYRVVSDGCIDIFFDLKNPANSSVMGFCKKFTEFSIGTAFNFGGIRFYPSAFPKLFGVSAELLKDKDQPLELVLPTMSEFLKETVQEDFRNSLTSLDNHLTSFLNQDKQELDSRFKDALMKILKQYGHLETDSELNVGISPRQLRRLFNYYIGTTPKSFAQVVRFQYILNARPSAQSLKENRIFYDVGFYDQAHFIKNFKRFYGVTPNQAFG